MPGSDPITSSATPTGRRSRRSDSRMTAARRRKAAHRQPGLFHSGWLTLTVSTDSHKTSSALRSKSWPDQTSNAGGPRPPRCAPAPFRPGRPRNREEAGSPCRSLITTGLRAPHRCLLDELPA